MWDYVPHVLPFAGDVATRRAMDLPLDRDPTTTMESDFSLSSWRIWSIGFQSDGVGDAWKNSTIAARSNRDRSAIEPRSLHLQHGIRAASLLIDLTGVVEASMPRSTPDRGPIVARSWPDRGEKRGPIVVVLEAKLKPSRRGIQAMSHAHGIAPSTLTNCFHNRVNYPRSLDRFSL